MITSTNTANYRALFDTAFAKLQEYHILDNYTDITAITSLEEYFYFLPELAVKLAKQPNEDVGQFMRIPLNEPHFIIDANTRKIIVPEAFDKNGVGVIGDQSAETIFFEVDRFFDTTDLNETMIYIQWINAAGEEGLSYAVWKTASDEKVVFGWALEDAIMSPAPSGDGGKIEFAVRFFNRGIDDKTGKETNELVYSLSTLPQTINIKKTLNFDVIDANVPTDLSDMLIKRLRKSTITESINPAEAPIIKIGPENNITVDLNENGVYLFKSQAYSTDSGIISYKLFKNNIEQSDPLYENGMALTDDIGSTNATDTYYKLTKGEDGREIFESYLHTAIPDNNTVIYERFGQFELTTAGTYHIQATNTKGLSTASANTNSITIPGPEEPIINNFIYNYQADENGVVPELSVSATAPAGILTYQWQKQNINNVYEDIVGATNSTYNGAEAENWYNVIVTNTRNNVSVSTDASPDIHVTAHVTTPSLTISELDYDVLKGGNIKVSWTRGERIDKIAVTLYRINNGVSTTGISPEEIISDSSKYTLIETKEDRESNALTFIANETGRYFVKVTNTRNTFESDPIYSNSYYSVTE